jgi:hypothetical protein
MNKVGVWKNERLVHGKPLAVCSNFPLEFLGYLPTKMNFISIPAQACAGNFPSPNRWPIQ